jgi:uncharacterized protein (TIGR02246 family)
LQRSCNARAQSLSAVDDDVLRATATLAEALARGDAAAAASLYADDGRLLTSAAEFLSGRGEIEEYWRAGIAFGLSRLDLQPIELRVTGRIAVEIGRYAVALEADGVAERGKYLVLHRLQPDGTWRRGVDVFNPHTPSDRKETQ